MDRRKWILGASLGVAMAILALGSCADSGARNLRAPPGLAVVTSSLRGGTRDVAYTPPDFVLATGGLLPYFWSHMGNLPNGMSFSQVGDTYQLAGTPTEAGAFAVNVTVDDFSIPIQSDTRMVTIDIFGITSTSPLPDATVGMAYSETLTFGGGVTPVTWALTMGMLPAGLILDPPTGDITGTPTTVGSSNFTVEATDSSVPPRVHSMSFDLDVIAPLPLPDLMVNEVFTGFVDWIELWNRSGMDLDVTGWTIVFVSSSMTVANQSYSFPSGTIIPADGFVEIRENGSPAADMPPTLFFTGYNLFWQIGNPGGGVSVEDSGGNSVDYMLFDCPGNPPNPPGLDWTCATMQCAPAICTVAPLSAQNMYRNTTTESNTPADWIQSAASTPGMRNPGQ